MPACPAGHESSATDFCDTCGVRIDGAPPSSSSAGTGTAPVGSAGAVGPAEPAEPCPQCGTERAGQFCEVCGFDFTSGTPARAEAPNTAAGSTVTAVPQAMAESVAAGAIATPAAGAGTLWTAVAAADRAYFDSVVTAGGPDAASLAFPAYCPERRFQLSGGEMRIGRRSASRGLEPEIDLTGPPTDPGVSHLHAVLIAQPDGTWSVLDPGSSNGTQVNGDDIAAGVPVPLHDGDRICLGAWTVLTMTVRGAGV